MRAALLVSLALLGCATDIAGGNVELRILATGSHAAAEPDAPRAVAVKDAGELGRVWQETIGGGQPPEIDFAKESMVILLAGQRRTGGWRVGPRGVTLEGTTLVVDAEIVGPPPDAIVTQALTSPYAVIAVNTKKFDEVRWVP